MAASNIHTAALVDQQLRRIQSTMVRGLASRLSRRTCSGAYTFAPPSRRNCFLERWYAGPWPALQSLLFLAAVLVLSHPNVTTVQSAALLKRIAKHI